MKLPRDVDADRLIRVLARYGYSVSRQVGSHIRLTRQDGSHNVTIPNHNPIKIGTLQKIIKDVCSANGLDVSEIVMKLE